MVRQRVHQPAFRARIMSGQLPANLLAGICITLKRVELLDAAHIIEDGQERGDPRRLQRFEPVQDRTMLHMTDDYLGISPDYVVKINAELLEEIDGPMLLTRTCRRCITEH